MPGAVAADGVGVEGVDDHGGAALVEVPTVQRRTVGGAAAARPAPRVPDSGSDSHQTPFGAGLQVAVPARRDGERDGPVL